VTSALAMASSHNRALYKCPITLTLLYFYCRDSARCGRRSWQPEMQWLLLAMQEDEKCLSDEDAPPPLPRRKHSEPFVQPPPSTSHQNRRPSVPSPHHPHQLPRSRLAPPQSAEEGRGSRREASEPRGAGSVPPPAAPTGCKQKSSLFHSSRRS